MYNLLNHFQIHIYRKLENYRLAFLKQHCLSYELLWLRKPLLKPLDNIKQEKGKKEIFIFHLVPPHPPPPLPSPLHFTFLFGKNPFIKAIQTDAPDTSLIQ